MNIPKELEILIPHQNIPNNTYKDCKIEIIDYATLNYNTFFENFMLKNRPCVIKNVSSDWECAKLWIKGDKINCEYIKNKYGDLMAPVADCSNITYNAQCKTDMTIRDYMNYFQSTDKMRLLYLKDWHLRRMQPNDIFYEVPYIFASDWLNEYAHDTKQDDFMFVYIGPKDSWTPLHADVYNSFSWSVNVFGRKKWTFFAPGEENKLKDKLGNLPLLFNPDLQIEVQYFEVIQETGDALFVPSGWHHQVINLEDTISVNHNWVNACNIEFVWRSLQKNLLEVENEIKEFKNSEDYEKQCQLILKSLFGMDYISFIDFLCYIVNKRLSQLHGKSYLGFSHYYLGVNYIKFDLNVILKVINLFCNEPINKYIKENINHNIHNLRHKILESIELCTKK